MTARGNFDFSPFSDDTINTMTVVWLPNGDAVIAMIAEESDDDADPTSSSGDSVFLAFFRRSEATRREGTNGEIYG